MKFKIDSQPAAIALDAYPVVQKVRDFLDSLPDGEMFHARDLSVLVNVKLDRLARYTALIGADYRAPGEVRGNPFLYGSKKTIAAWKASK